MIVWMTGSTCIRDADGIFAPVIVNGNHIKPACAVNSTCPYGLMNYFQVLLNLIYFSGILKE